MNEKSKGKKARRKPVNMLFVLKLNLEMSLMALQCTLSLSPRMQIQRRGRRMRRRNGTNLIHQCGNRQNKGVERGGERDWKKSEGRGKEMRSECREPSENSCLIRKGMALSTCGDYCYQLTYLKTDTCGDKKQILKKCVKYRVV